MKTTIGTHCTVTSSKRFHLSERAESGVPFFCSKQIIQLENGEMPSDYDHITNEHFRDIQIKYGVPSSGDLLITTRGTYGIPYIYKERDCFYFADGNLTWLKDFDDCLSSHYLYYWFKSYEGQKKIDAIAKGTAQKAVPIALIKDLQLTLPPISQQKRIASILSAYDDLIENNRRQIKLLEEAAQRLYSEWFVELRFPGHESVKVVDGVPEGWTVTTASEVTNVLRRGISPNYDETARLSVISQKCIRQYMVDMNQVRRQSKSFDSSMGLLDSDTVICSTGTGTLGRVGTVFGNHSNCTFDSHVTLVRTNGTVGKHYLNLRMYELQEYFDSCKTGSTNQTELSRSIVQNVKVYIADSHTQQIFEKIEEAYHQKMMICQHQIQLLTETRDRLLPKLMNGEMEV